MISSVCIIIRFQVSSVSPLNGGSRGGVHSTTLSKILSHMECKTRAGHGLLQAEPTASRGPILFRVVMGDIIFQLCYVVTMAPCMISMYQRCTRFTIIILFSLTVLGI